MRRTGSLWAGLAATVVSLGANVEFRGLGHLPGGRYSSADGVSANGGVVVGVSSAAGSGYSACYWAGRGGAQLVPLPTGWGRESAAWAVSGDGQTIVGSGDVALDWVEAFKWTYGEASVGLGILPGGIWSEPSWVSHDGAIVIGTSDSGAGHALCIWQDDQMTGHLFGSVAGLAWDASADGTVVTGSRMGGGAARAFRWIAETGFVDLDELDPDWGLETYGRAIRADGRMLFGDSLTRRGREAYRWSAPLGMTPLSITWDGDEMATDCTPDGRVIVGAASRRACFWSLGRRVDLTTFLLEGGVRSVQGWQLGTAAGVSADGRVIVGTGLNPQGDREAWRAAIPRFDGSEIR